MEEQYSYPGTDSNLRYLNNSMRQIRISKSYVLLSLFILPLAFDFQGKEAGGGIPQFAFTGLTLVAAFQLFLRAGYTKPAGKLWQFTFLAIVTSLFGSVCSFLFNPVPFGNYIRVVMPWALFALGFFVSSTETYRGNANRLKSLIVAGCVASLIFSLVMGFALTGVGVEEIRYRILSPVLLAYEAILLHQLMIERRRTVWAVLALSACVVLQLISVTRSSILALLLIYSGTVWIASRSVLQFTIKSLTSSMRLSLIGSLALGVSLLVYPGILDHWFSRIFGFRSTGADITSITRIAEMDEQITMWRGSVPTILFGKGYGAEYAWSSRYFHDLAPSFTSAYLENGRYFEAGHDFWVYSLFAGGILFGTLLPVALIYATYRGITASRQYITLDGDHPMGMALSRSTLISVAMLGGTIGGNPFAFRYSGLMWGLALGMLIASSRVLERSGPRSRIIRSPVAVSDRYPSGPLLSP